MSWWKTLFGWSTAQTPAPTEASATLITDVALSELTENEDSLYTDAARFVLSTRSCSISALQQHLKIGYNRAARLIEALEDDCVVSKMSPNGNRHLLNEQQRNATRLLSSAGLGRHGKVEESALRVDYITDESCEEVLLSDPSRDQLLVEARNLIALTGRKSEHELARSLRISQKLASSLIDSMKHDPELELFAAEPKLTSKINSPKTGKKPIRTQPEKVTLPPLSGRLTGSQKCAFNIVGESHYQPALRRLRNSRHMATDNDFSANIVTEPDNPHDSNACAIYIESLKVGYLPRDAATEFVRQMAEVGLSGAFNIQAKAKLSGGWGDRPPIGVLINLPRSKD